MKKAERIDSPEITLDESTARIIPLRTETALSRFPIHRLSKKGTIKIQQTKKDKHGKTLVLWEVTHPPGPLAYKLDTSIINRRIDEMRNRGDIPQLIKLGSLRSICEELGFAVSGHITNQIKAALRENAGALITARLDYRGNDGALQSFEFSSTRYAIILTGQNLPGGTKADAVYIYFHDLFLSMLNRAQTRPLDYEYLKALPPAAQRLYELVSFGIFGSLRHGRNCATMLYSELCTSAPLTRYCEWERVRKQMYKIHKPHIESGYLKAVEFEETTDAAGRLDWIIRYTPGPKAKREYREFAKRREEATSAPPAAPRPVPAPIPAPLLPELAGAEDPLIAHRIERLVAAGFGRSAATDLASEYPEECDRQLNALPARNLSAVRDRIAWLRCAIREGYSTPAAPEQGSPAALEAEQAIAQAKQANAEKAVSCELCRNTASWRPVKDPTNPKGYSFKQCSHNPEKESKYEPAW